MGYTYIPLIIAGMLLTGWGLPASYRLRSPLRVLAALAALCGIVASLFGFLLLAVPNFFTR